MIRYLFIFGFLLIAGGAQAQKMPERSLVRKGNRQYDKGNYERSVEHYKEALTKAPGSFEATYNLGNGLYKAGSFEQAEQTMGAAAADSLHSEAERAEAFYNLGNAQFQQKKYPQALESFKNSLRLNPADSQAKFNYAYTKYLLDQQQQDKQDQDKDQQDKQDQNQDQQNQDQQDKQDQNQDQQDEQQNQDQQPQQDKEQPGQSQQTESGISPQEQERMLEAIQAQEDRTQEKLKEKQGVVVRGRKNW